MSTPSSSVGDTWVDVARNEDSLAEATRVDDQTEECARTEGAHGSQSSNPLQLATSEDNSTHAPPSLPASDAGTEHFASGMLPAVSEATTADAVSEATTAEGAAGNAKPDGDLASGASEPECGDQLDTEWSRAECHMNDIRYAQKSNPSVPERVQKLGYNIMAVGQPETGKTTTLRNLFASLEQDADFQLADVSHLTKEDFTSKPEQFVTAVTCKDSTLKHWVTYSVLETPALRSEGDVLAALVTYIEDRQDEYAAQERNVGLPREACVDRCVNVVLYFLPTNARVAQLDVDAMQALSKLVPVVPVMCKADCLEEHEVHARKDEMARLVEGGLACHAFPPAIMRDTYEAAYGLSAHIGADGEPEPAPFRLPFNVVAGNDADRAVHPFWFVRKYRWAVCEAYCTSNSDLKLLRQLLLEDGFWHVKEAADAIYRARMRSAAAPALEAPGRAAPPPDVAAAVRAAAMAAPSSSAASTASAAPKPAPAPYPTVTPPTASSGESAPRRAAPHEDLLSGFFCGTQPPCAEPSPMSRRARATSRARAAAADASAGANDVFSLFDSASDAPPPFVSTSSARNNSRALGASLGRAAAGVVAGAFANAFHPDGTPHPSCPSEPHPTRTAATNTDTDSHAAGAHRNPTPRDTPVDTFDEGDFSSVAVRDIVASGGGERKGYRMTLKVEGEERVLCLRIGQVEGDSLTRVLNSERRCISRPSAYDTMAAMLSALGCTVRRVVITECTKTLFYARIHAVNTASGKFVDLDARPSDAINVAVRREAPVYVRDSVLAKYAKAE